MVPMAQPMPRMSLHGRLGQRESASAPGRMAASLTIRSFRSTAAIVKRQARPRLCRGHVKDASPRATEPNIGKRKTGGLQLPLMFAQRARTGSLSITADPYFIFAYQPIWRILPRMISAFAFIRAGFRRIGFGSMAARRADCSRDNPDACTP